jgi:hypothetical protein
MWSSLRFHRIVPTMVSSVAQFTALLSALAFTTPLVLAGWPIKDTYIGSSFLSGFTHEAIADPTHGRVKYALFLSTVMVICLLTLLVLATSVNLMH